MKILAFDTALDACSVAALDGARVLAARFEARARGHAEALLPMLEAVRAEAGLAYAAFDRLAVTVGPGTFTGIRVGVAAARGLTLATGVPAYGVTTLAALAQAARDAEALVPGAYIVAAIDARRDEAYRQVFAATADGGIEALDEARRDSLPDILAALAEDTGWLAGSAAPLLLGRLARPAAWRIAAAVVDARVVAALAGRQPQAPFAVPPVPLYLRAPDAKLPSRKPFVPGGSPPTK